MNNICDFCYVTQNVELIILLLQNPPYDHYLDVHIYNVYVVVQFYPWFKFYFPLFWGMVMYVNEFETKENKIWTKDKVEPQHIHGRPGVSNLGGKGGYLKPHSIENNKA